ncbi:MAG: hypothetical protein KDN19_10165 [Verrucomicrobiae bacterium]|nr:hypothetical protein [Verrucomicrobiae bacterium]
MKPHLGGDAPRKRHAAPRRKVARKTVRRAGATPPRHRRPVHGPVDSGFSPMTVFLLIIALGLAGLIAMMLMPKKLKQIKGYPAEIVTEKPRNLLSEVQAVLVAEEGDPTEITLTEEEINHYLSERIGGEQAGVLGALVKFQGVYTDLEPGSAEVYVVRSVFGLPFAVSMRFVLEKQGYLQQWDSAGGAIGRIRLSGKRQFKPITDAFRRVIKVTEDEWSAIRHFEGSEDGTVVGQDEITFKRK